ncbi:hypothetical protein SELMODRAFT_34524, partial [Selaginella moellendorffii]
AQAPAMFIFGDSTVDAGNNNFLPTYARANHRPYGMSFPGGLPTGRFTNGKTVPDFIAQNLGLPLVPPYRGTRSYGRGVNFASASSGILPTTRLNGALVMDQQLDDFERVADVLYATMGNHAASQFFAKSIFYISVGNNDVNNFFRSSTNKNRLTSLPADFQANLLARFAQQITRMHSRGARKFVIVGLSAVGCIPVNQKNGQCDEHANEVSVMFNAALDEMLDGLRKSLDGVAIVKPDYYGLMVETMKNPSKYGFSNTARGCCTGSMFCGVNAPACLRPDSYMYFDGIHHTQSLYKIAAQRWWSGGKGDVSPVNIQQLA